MSPKKLEALRLVSRGLFYPDLVREDDGWHARWRAWAAEDNVWLDDVVREATVTPLSDNAESRCHATLHDAWMAALASTTGLVRWPDAECAAFARELARWHSSGSDLPRAAVKLSFDAASCAVSTEIPGDTDTLRALGEAATFFRPLAGLRREGGRLACTLTNDEVQEFLSSGVRALAEAGYAVCGADVSSEIAIAAELKAPPRETSKAAVKAKLVIRVAGHPVTAAEIRFLLAQKSPFVFFHGHWIEVDRSILKAALRALEKNGLADLSSQQAIAFALGIGCVGRLEIADVACHGWVRGLVNSLKASKADLPPSVLKGFVGTLRDYQLRGVAWLAFLTDHGFGALLADDMGLGKTAQAIAWMLLGRVPGGKVKTLVVAPLTLLQNWAHEFAKFAPSLKIYVHQGECRHFGSGFRHAVAESDVTVTSYGLLVKEHLSFGEIAWDEMVLDEAQIVKNPQTQTARAVRALRPRRRIALTGTPIENSLLDVWSIEEFLNPGFLGDRTDFVERFVKPVRGDVNSPQGARLRRALEPFVLRRVKSDPAIAAELGEKRVIREYCQLTVRERGAYEAALSEYRFAERRKGDVFALITRLKLICDGFGEGRVKGGKLDRLVELAGQILENGESTLVFTQYAKVGRSLRAILEETFSRKVAFLHGELTAAQREREVAEFNERGGIFILSLRAGGFGLNLTRATHVIHFDRWWNPAIENQATDRAHRIGQDKTVFVHDFIASGTIEERVDDILTRKDAVSNALVTSGEAYLNQLAEDELLKLAKLEGE